MKTEAQEYYQEQYQQQQREYWAKTRDFNNEFIDSCLKPSIYKDFEYTKISSPFMISYKNLVFEQGGIFYGNQTVQKNNWIPLIVTKRKDGNYIVLDGYHRFREWMQTCNDCENIEVIEI